MAAEEGVYEARQLSEAFVEQYYHLVGTMTHEAHKLYVDVSLVTRPGPDGTMMSFTSLEAIKNHYLSSYYDGTTFVVRSVDSQSSLGDGLFVMVIGFLTGKDNLKRKFSQSFYLARQNGVHVVVNDIYRLVDESVAKSLEEIKKIAQVCKVDAPAKKSLNLVEVKQVVTAQKPKEPVSETVTPSLDGVKKSYASMVLSMSGNATPVQRPKSMAQPKPRSAPAPKAPATVSKPEKKTDQGMVDEPGTSIFVSNLPMDAMPPQLHELFKGFGPIKAKGVQIRSTRASGRCFGFVAFESVASVQSVLKAAKSNPFKLGEHKLRVKEKQVDHDGSKPSGGRSGGGSKSQRGSVYERETQTGSADGSKTENGSVSGEEDGEFKLVRSRRNRREKR